MLKISSSLSLPLELAARTQCILAQKGAGKTYTGMKETEKMLDAGVQVVCLDPTGVWWGLRSSADGAREGYAIIVMGGDHADVPLEPHAGEIVADFVVDSGQSVILDMSGFESNAAQDRFATQFAERVYRRKASSRSSLHLMIDEADSFAPQRPLPGQQKMLGAFEALVRRGRSRGIGVTMISQRPAVLNKNVLSQADLLVCLRVVGKHDFEAVKEWTNLNATKEDSALFLRTLPTLADGEAWFWSPSWLGIFQRAKVAKRTTFDSSSTPAPGEMRIEPKKLAPVDLAKLSAEIKSAADRVKANDPAELKREIAALRRQIEEDDEPLTSFVSVLTDEDRALLKDAREWAERLFSEADNAVSKVKAVYDSALVEFGKIGAVFRKADYANMQQNLHKSIERSPGVSRTQTDGAPTGGMRRMMIALAQRPGLNGRQLGIRAGMSSKSGTFGTYLGKLRSAGFLYGGREAMQLTKAGFQVLGAYEPLPTGNMLYYFWMGELGSGGITRILAALYNAHPNALDKEELGRRAEISHTSGTFGTYLGKLRSLELITGSRELRASEEFFEG
jgi:uncharacterized protein